MLVLKSMLDDVAKENISSKFFILPVWKPYTTQSEHNRFHRSKGKLMTNVPINLNSETSKKHNFLVDHDEIIRRKEIHGTIESVFPLESSSELKKSFLIFH